MCGCGNVGEVGKVGTVENELQLWAGGWLTHAVPRILLQRLYKATNSTSFTQTSCEFVRCQCTLYDDKRANRVDCHDSQSFSLITFPPSS